MPNEPGTWKQSVVKTVWTCHLTCRLASREKPCTAHQPVSIFSAPGSQFTMAHSCGQLSQGRVSVGGVQQLLLESTGVEFTQAGLAILPPSSTSTLLVTAPPRSCCQPSHPPPQPRACLRWQTNAFAEATKDVRLLIRVESSWLLSRGVLPPPALCCPG